MFFLQAEDGIRDLVRSRGLGDVYKRQVHNGGTLVSSFNTGLVDEHDVAPENGFPHDLTDLLSLIHI